MKYQLSGHPSRVGSTVVSSRGSPGSRDGMRFGESRPLLVLLSSTTSPPVQAAEYFDSATTLSADISHRATTLNRAILPLRRRDKGIPLYQKLCTCPCFLRLFFRRIAPVVGRPFFCLIPPSLRSSNTYRDFKRCTQEFKSPRGDPWADLLMRSPDFLR